MASDDTRVFIPVDEPLTPVSLAIVKRLLAEQGLYVVDKEQMALLTLATIARRRKPENPG